VKQEMMGWQWHQLDHMQIICTSLQTDNHASSSSLTFYSLDAFADAEPTVKAVKASPWKAAIKTKMMVWS